jgi:hypothetical protein
MIPITSKPTIACTDAERVVLELFLRELRHATALNQQLHVLVDPHTGGVGVDLHFSYNLAGHSETVSGRIQQKKLPTPAAKAGKKDLGRFQLCRFCKKPTGSLSRTCKST